MATRRAEVSAAIQKDVEGRDFEAHGDHAEGFGAAPASVPARRMKAPMQMVRVRMDGGDFAQLQRIAEQQGTNASALIRRAVKKLIRIDAAI
jgi:hypothetical protein